MLKRFAGSACTFWFRVKPQEQPGLSQIVFT